MMVPNVADYGTDPPRGPVAVVNTDEKERAIWIVLDVRAVPPPVEMLTNRSAPSGGSLLPFIGHLLRHVQPALQLRWWQAVEQRAGSICSGLGLRPDEFGPP
jgi:hypothetical protein